ncbi:hypothetical protein HDU67_001042, partial [Dinochytrium kinnereticum]
MDSLRRQLSDSIATSQRHERRLRKLEMVVKDLCKVLALNAIDVPTLAETLGEEEENDKVLDIVNELGREGGDERWGVDLKKEKDGNADEAFETFTQKSSVAADLLQIKDEDLEENPRVSYFGRKTREGQRRKSFTFKDKDKANDDDDRINQIRADHDRRATSSSSTRRLLVDSDNDSEDPITSSKLPTQPSTKQTSSPQPLTSKQASDINLTSWTDVLRSKGPKKALGLLKDRDRREVDQIAKTIVELTKGDEHVHRVMAKGGKSDWVGIPKGMEQMFLVQFDQWRSEKGFKGGDGDSDVEEGRQKPASGSSKKKKEDVGEFKSDDEDPRRKPMPVSTSSSSKKKKDDTAGQTKIAWE